MDYATLKLIWWALLGIVLIGYAIMDGFDLGVTSLVPFVGKNDIEKRMMINSIGPFWEGNQIWLITGGGVIFAAWPYVYATSFSGFYFAMILLLLALILRPVAFKVRSKQPSFGWRTTWDWVHCFTGVVPALVAGVAVGNVILGVPFHFDHESLQLYYTGKFFDLFSPFALLIGLISVAMLIRHGALFAAIKVDEPIRSRTIQVSHWASIVFILLMVIAGAWVPHLVGYKIISSMDHNAFASPIHKTVIRAAGVYGAHGWTYIIPGIAILASIASIVHSSKRRLGFAFLASSVSIFATVTTAGVGMFPFIIPSSSNPSESLTVWDASSSMLTLKLMLIITCTVLPIVLGYTIWVYYKMRGTLLAAMFGPNDETATEANDNSHLY